MSPRSQLPVSKAQMMTKARESQGSVYELRNHIRFRDTHVHAHRLGAGGDGTVDLWKHKRSGAFVAVKTPHHSNTSLPDPSLVKEAKNLECLGKHPHIVEMLTYSETYLPRGPAIFLEYTPLGDLGTYEGNLLIHQVKQQRPEQIPEVTVCKLLRDMGLALEYLHGKGFVHTDVKPDNILVFSPDGWKAENGTPILPVFKLTDFSRMVPFPLTGRAMAEYKHLGGTPEFAPPLSERKCLRPSGDMWSLGCTIQCFALGIVPTQSQDAFVADRKKAGGQYPPPYNPRAWYENKWRLAVPNLYRPLNVTQAELARNWDVPRQHGVARIDTPYSTYLNTWYKALWDADEKTRITAKALAEHFVSMIDNDIELAEAEQLAEASFKSANILRGHVVSRQFALKRGDTREDSAIQGLGNRIAEL